MGNMFTIVWYENSKKREETFYGSLDRARVFAISKCEKAGYTVYILRGDGKPFYAKKQGELWLYNDYVREYYYLPMRDNSVIWKVNPRTGKLISKVGELD